MNNLIFRTKIELTKMTLAKKDAYKNGVSINKAYKNDLQNKNASSKIGKRSYKFAQF